MKRKWFGQASTWIAMFNVILFFSVVLLRPFFDLSRLLYVYVGSFSAIVIGRLVQRILPDGVGWQKTVLWAECLTLIALAILANSGRLLQLQVVMSFVGLSLGSLLAGGTARNAREGFRLASLQIVLILTCNGIADFQKAEEWFRIVSVTAGGLAAIDRAVEFALSASRTFLLDPILASAAFSIAVGCAEPLLGIRVGSSRVGFSDFIVAFTFIWAALAWIRVSMGKTLLNHR